MVNEVETIVVNKGEVGRVLSEVNQKISKHRLKHHCWKMIGVCEIENKIEIQYEITENQAFHR